jgi:nitrate reductase beta subunit
MRKQQVTGEVDETLGASVGLTASDLETMYRLLAIAKYEERYVIPKAHRELASELMEQQGGCGLDFEGGPGNCGAVQPSKGFMLTKKLPIVGQKPSGGGHQ